MSKRDLNFIRSPFNFFLEHMECLVCKALSFNRQIEKVISKFGSLLFALRPAELLAQH
jgi:hypothetical protein